LVELSLRRLTAFVVIAFLGGVLMERWLSLTEPVARVMAPVAATVGVPLLWLVAGALAGAAGVVIFGRVREANSLDKIGTARFKRDADRF